MLFSQVQVMIFETACEIMYNVDKSLIISTKALPFVEIVERDEQHYVASKLHRVQPARSSPCDDIARIFHLRGKHKIAMF
jgi:hypothetical protein